MLLAISHACFIASFRRAFTSADALIFDSAAVSSDCTSMHRCFNSSIVSGAASLYLQQNTLIYPLRAVQSSTLERIKMYWIPAFTFEKLDTHILIITLSK